MTEKQMHWIGTFVQDAVVLVISFTFLQFFGLISFKRPLAVEVAGVALIVALGATWETYRFYAGRARHAR